MFGGLDTSFMSLIKAGIDFATSEYAIMTNGSLYGCFKFLKYAIYLGASAQVLEVFTKSREAKQQGVPFNYNKNKGKN